MSLKEYSAEEVARHDKEGDLWVAIDSKVYDLSKFAAHHPGGLSVLLDSEVAGKDATEAFFGLHRQEILENPRTKKFVIGTLAGARQTIFPRPSGGLSTIPYAEPTWLSKGYYSPYYKDHHRKLQIAYRKFMDETVIPDAQICDEQGKRPSQHVFDEMARLNLLPMWLGPGPHLKGLTLMGGIVKPEEFDPFHELIMAQEAARINARGYHDGLGGGSLIGLPPVINFAKPHVRDRILKDIFSGKKHLALAISEAFAGSDVAGIRCLARRVEGGWRLTGTKKWITNATFADYFTVGARTERGGLLVLVVERQEGIETKPIKTAYSHSAGTGYITFDNVFVPEENLIGEEEKGLQVILANFNHERWFMLAASIAAQRLIVEECLKWVNQRKVFGKPLHNQAVVRNRLASMISRVETGQAWLENITYQMYNMKYHEQSELLAGPIALLKRYTTSTAQETAADAVQIFGGRGLTRTGMGKHIEHYHTTVTFDAVLGGAEDVLGDLGVRQALRRMPKNARL